MPKLEQIIQVILMVSITATTHPGAWAAEDFNPPPQEITPEGALSAAPPRDDLRTSEAGSFAAAGDGKTAPGLLHVAEDPPAEPEGAQEFGGNEEFFAEFESEFEVPEKEEIFDPLSGYNRVMTQVNDKFYLWILKPAASGYRFVTPQFVRTSIARFFNNLLFPVRFVNNILQLKLRRAGTELARFGMNTTVGIAGFADPAAKWLALQAYPEDFGQTLGRYGIGIGFHMVLPILGPSNLRDTVGLVPDFFLDPVCYVGSCLGGYREAAWGIRSLQTVNRASLHLGEYENIRKDAIDLYTFLREAYEQNRQKEVAH